MCPKLQEFLVISATKIWHGQVVVVDMIICCDCYVFRMKKWMRGVHVNYNSSHPKTNGQKVDFAIVVCTIEFICQFLVVGVTIYCD